MDTSAQSAPPDRRSALHAVPQAWEGATVKYPAEKCVHELFAEQAAHTPDAVALEFGSARLTYAQLDARSNRLAHRLRAAATSPGDLIGVCIERSFDFVVALLGVLKAGAAYVPLDPSYPAARNSALLRRSAARLLVTKSGPGRLVPPYGIEAIAVDRLDSGLPETAPSAAVTPDDLACVLFTSGSTGGPKGSASPHRATVRTFFGQGYVDFGPDEKWLQCAPVSWDVLSLELWSALLHGGRCVLAPGQRPDAAEIERLVRQHEVTTLWLSAGLFNVMADSYSSVFGLVRQVMTGGESPSMRHLRKIKLAFPELRLVHGYGPVESMVFTTWHLVTTQDVAKTTIPIGAPMRNTRVHVLDPAGCRLPIGDVGELFIGGDGLADSYLGRSGLTAERFVPDPFAVTAGGRLYRTGDMVRWLHCGELEFVGRADRQIKIRGFRVELDEVEAALLEQPEVRQAAVLATEDMPGERRLLAYVVLVSPAGEDLGTTLREQLGKQLPDYMIPSKFMALEEFPLTASGKLDRDALRTIREGRDPALPPATMPRTPVEDVLTQIWIEVLGTESIGVDDDFFRLGGDSIQIMRIVAKARSRGLVVSPRTFYQHRTVAALAVTAKSAGNNNDGAEVRSRRSGAADAGQALETPPGPDPPELRHIDAIARCKAAIQPGRT